MSGKKALSHGFAECFGRAPGDLYLRTANIGDERAWRKRWSETVDVIENRHHRSGQYDEITTAYGVGGINNTGVDGPAFACAFKHRRAIAADNAAREMALLQGQTQRSANQSGADDSDLLECHL